MSFIIFQNMNRKKYHHDSEDNLLMAFVALIGVIALLVMGFHAFLRINFNEEPHKYVVQGKIVLFQDRQVFKNTTVFVYVLQQDGVTRAYNTGVKSHECKRTQIGQSLPVTVTSTYNSFFGDTVHDSKLSYNPCV